MFNELNDWITNSIKTQQDKIDTANMRCWDDIKHRSEGYLEALYHIQRFLNSKLMKREAA